MPSMRVPEFAGLAEVPVMALWFGGNLRFDPPPDGLKTTMEPTLKILTVPLALSQRCRTR